MRRNGFGLLEILIAVAIIAILVGGAFYFTNRNGVSMVQTGIDAHQEAQDVVGKMNIETQNTDNLINQVH